MAGAKRKSDPAAAKAPPPKKRRASQEEQYVTIPREEPMFPRGGGSALTPLEQKQIQIQAKQDVLFEQKTGQKVSRHEFDDMDEDDNDDQENARSDTAGQSKSKKSKSEKKKNKKGSKAKDSEAVDGNTVKIESLSYKRLVPGSLVLGQVSEITSHDIALSLPNNLTGYVPLTSISPLVRSKIEEQNAQAEGSSDEEEDEASNSTGMDLSAMFRVGQYLRAYVLATGDDSTTTGKLKRHISLSIEPRQANAGLKSSELVDNSMVQATVTSVEDHGLVMEIELEDGIVKGFMGLKNMGPVASDAGLQDGAVILCLVIGRSSNGSIVKLSADPQKIKDVKKAFLADAPTVDAFLPGTAVEVLVAEIGPTGVIGKIMGLLNVTADVIHACLPLDAKFERKHPPGSKVKARIISTFPASEPKKVACSFQEHIVHLHQRLPKGSSHDPDALPLAQLPLSSIIESAKVVSVDVHNGLFLDVGVKNIIAFAHISKVSDSNIESLGESTGPYKTGSTHKARVIGYNAMDGMFIVSLEESVIAQQFLRYEDVHISQTVKGTIQKILVGTEGLTGLVIALAYGITGLVPEIHLSDVRLQHPERKFKEGASVTAKVITTDPAKRKIHLTLKKALVNSDVQPWSDYRDLKVGMQSPGTIVNLLPKGAVLQFFGRVRGFLPVSEMSEAYIEDPREHFRIGQTVNVYVTSVNAEAQRLSLSCKGPGESASAEQLEAFAKLPLGEEVDGKVVSKTNENVVLELAIPKLKGVLNVEQLIDGSAAKASSALQRIRVGQSMSGLMVLSKRESSQTIHLTSRPSILKAAKENKFLAGFDEARQGMDVIGFVNNITGSGVFVQFLGNLTALIPKQLLSDDIIRLPDFGLQKHQVVFAKVASIDHPQQRLVLTQKPLVEKDEFQEGESSLSNAIDPGISSYDDLTLGRITKAKINSVKETQLNVQLAEGIQGRVDLSSAFDGLDSIKDKKHPLKHFQPKEIIDVRILGMHDSRNHRFLPITHRAKAPVFELTAKPSDLQSPELNILTLDKVKKGSSWPVFVNNVNDDCVWVNLSPNVRGRIRAQDLSDDLSALTNLPKSYPVGSAIQATVTKIDLENNRLDLSARHGKAVRPLQLKDFSVGQILPGRVTKITERQIMVQLSDEVSAPVHLVDLADDFSKANPWLYTKNQIVRVCIKEIDLPNKKLILSTRPSVVLSSSLPVEDVDLKSASDVKVNDTRRGFIKNVADNGLFVALSSYVTAFVRVTNLSDQFLKDWKSSFEIDQLVTGRIVAVDESSGHVQMSLKQSHVDNGYSDPRSFNDIEVGEVITGKVRKIEDFGVFVVLDNSSNVSGLCHRSNMSDRPSANPRKLYQEGDAVQAKVLKIDREKRQISLGMKTSMFDVGSEDGSDFEGINEESKLANGVGDDHSEGGVDLDMNDAQGVSGIEALDITEESDSEMDIDQPNGVTLSSIEPKEHQTNVFPGLSAGGVDWTGENMRFPDKEPLLESEDEDGKRKKKRRKANPQRDITGDLDANGPQSQSDYERLLLGRPNSSVLWLGYMAFYLELGEVAKAREIGERALHTIHINEQGEKFNVWIAMLNLESAYGDEETLDGIFQRAVQHNDGQEIHERLISIYIQSGLHRKADDLFHTTLKKYTQAPGLYLNYATFLLSTMNEPDRARAVLPRAVQALPPHTHVNLTSKFAQLEFTSPNGEPERGRTIFETLLSQWPKRLDLWNILLDLEIKIGDKDTVRRLFERVTLGMKLKPKKAKFFFKRWLEWEAKVGDAKGQERVKCLATDYVEEKEKEKAAEESAT